MTEELNHEPGRSLWSDAWLRMKKDKLAIFSMVVIAIYAVIAVLCQLGVIGADWRASVGASYGPPSTDGFLTLFGMDIFGYSVLSKVIQGTRIAMTVGLLSCVVSMVIGIALGAVAGYFGGLIDELIMWLITTVTSIPSIMLLISIAFVMGKGLSTVVVAIGLTSWVGLARVIRGEFIKHKSRDYVMAAMSLGASHTSRIFKHILPNVSHQIVIMFTILFQSAIKSEVILSYLGLGVQGQPSWGIMIDDSKLELARGVWWQLTSATAAVFFLILAFNIFGDALRDSLDPKLKD